MTAKSNIKCHYWASSQNDRKLDECRSSNHWTFTN